MIHKSGRGVNRQSREVVVNRSKSWRNGIGGAVCAIALSACGETPLASSGESSSSVRFSLEGVRGSSGAFVCEEADLATLLVSPVGETPRMKRRELGSGEDCSVTFPITVPKGRVRFTGQLVGRGRPLMRGTPPVFRAEKDGFVVHVDLTEIDALDVQTRTIGLGGPASYTFDVDGTRGGRPIARDGADTLAALAGGGRFVTLHPEPCVVVNGNARREVMIPPQEQVLGATMFEIDCSAGGEVGIITITEGGPGPKDYTVFVDGRPGQPIGRRDSIGVTGVTPGPVDVWVETGDPSCVVTQVTPGPHFLPTGGQIQLVFRIVCGVEATGQPPTPLTRIRVVTRISQPPLPGEIETFDAIVTDAAGIAQTQPMVVSDSVTFIFGSPPQNPYGATLLPTGTCFIKSGVSTQSVSAFTGGLTRVVFDVGC